MKKLFISFVFFTMHISLAEIINPRRFLNHENVDVVLWHLALKYAKNDISCPWLYSYAEQVSEAMNCDNKLSLEYVHTLVQENRKDKKSKQVVVSDNGVVIEGIEYIALALLRDENVECTRESNTVLEPLTFTVLKDCGLDQEILEWMVLEFMKLHGNCFNMLLWPNGNKWKERVYKRVSEEDIVIYQKKFELKNHGHRLFVQQIQGKETKLNDLVNLYFKSSSKPASLTLFVIESTKEAKQMRRFKSIIRKEIGYPGYAHLHSDRDSKEAITTCQMILHKATLDFINSVSYVPKSCCKSIINKFVSKNKLIDGDNDFFCGIHKDFFCGVNFKTLASDQKIQCVASEPATDSLGHMNHTMSKEERDELIYDPTKFFYYRNIKFKKEF